MPPRGLPGNANLEQLRNGAKSFARAVRAGDAGAAAVVHEFHPRLRDAAVGSPELAAFSRADAPLVVARRFGFASWPRLKAHLELVAPLARSPHEVGPSDRAADEFLRLACLTYGDDEPARWAEAERMLVAAPELTTANLATIAAVGAFDAARELLGREPGGVRVSGRRFPTRAQRCDAPAGQLAGWLAGWLTIAGRLERDLDVNITRQGVVWLPVVALGPGEHALVKRIAEASLALYQDLLELGG